MYLLKSSAKNIKVAAKSIAAGNLVAFPTETVYGLGADATNRFAVSKIYRVKERPLNHPLIVHIPSMALIDKWSEEVCEYAINLARDFWPGPMTLILKRSQLAKNFVTGNQNTVGLRVPNQPVALELLNEFEKLGGDGIAAPSANRFGSVSPTTAEAVKDELEKYLDKRHDKVLDGGQCQIGLESTIIDCTSDIPRILRPGAITKEMIAKSTGLLAVKLLSRNIRVSGALKVHYSPKAKVVLDTKTKNSDGFIAIDSIPTPAGLVRVAAPRSTDEFAREIYAALRFADSLGLSEICVIQPKGDGLASAIRDRLKRASRT